MNRKARSWIILLSIVLVLPIFVTAVSSQTPSNYYVTVEPDFLSHAVQYWSVGRVVALSFRAFWTYGPNSEKSIQNATVTIEVTDQNDKAVDNLCVNSGNGTFSFNYTSKNPVILAFTPTKLITQDGLEWDSSLVDSGNNVYGFTCHWIQVWWDTFQVSLVSRNVDSSGNVAVSVNVTQLLLPEGGLLVGPAYVAKVVQGANVTINGVKAEKSQTPGIYSANNSAWLQTNSFTVEVSKDYWTTISTDLVYGNQVFLVSTPTPTPQSTEEPFPIPIVAAVSGAIVVIVVVSAGLQLVYFKKRKHEA